MFYFKRTNSYGPHGRRPQRSSRSSRLFAQKPGRSILNGDSFNAGERTTPLLFAIRRRVRRFRVRPRARSFVALRVAIVFVSESMLGQEFERNPSG